MKHISRAPLDLDVVYMGLADLSCSWYCGDRALAQISQIPQQASAPISTSAREAFLLTNSRVKSTELSKIYPLSLVVDSNDVVSLYDFHTRTRLWSNQANDMANSCNITGQFVVKPNKSLSLSCKELPRPYGGEPLRSESLALSSTGVLDLEEELNRIEIESVGYSADNSKSNAYVIDTGAVIKAVFLDFQQSFHCSQSGSSASTSRASDSIASATAMVRIGIICEKGIIIRDLSSSIWISNAVSGNSIISSVTDMTSVSRNIIAIAVTGGDIYFLNTSQPMQGFLACISPSPASTISGSKCDINLLMNISETRSPHNDSKVSVFRLLSVLSDSTCLIWEGIIHPNAHHSYWSDEDDVNIIIIDNRPIAKLLDNQATGNKHILGHFSSSGSPASNTSILTGTGSVLFSSTMGGNSNVFIDHSTNSIVIISADKSIRSWNLNAIYSPQSPTNIKLQKITSANNISSFPKASLDAKPSIEKDNEDLINAPKTAKKGTMFGWNSGSQVEDSSGIPYSLACSRKMGFNFSSNVGDPSTSKSFGASISVNTISSIAKVRSDHPMVSSIDETNNNGEVYVVACKSSSIGILQAPGSREDGQGEIKLIYEISLIPLIKRYLESLSPQELIISALLPTPTSLAESNTKSSNKQCSHILNNLKIMSCHSHLLYKDSIILMTNIGIIVLGLDYIRTPLLGRHPKLGHKVISYKYPNRFSISELKIGEIETSFTSNSESATFLSEPIESLINSYNYSNPAVSPSSGMGLFGSMDPSYCQATGHLPAVRPSIFVSPSGKFVCFFSSFTCRYTICAIHIISGSNDRLEEIDKGMANSFGWIGTKDIFITVSPPITTATISKDPAMKERRQSMFFGRSDENEGRKVLISVEAPITVVKQIISSSSSSFIVKPLIITNIEEFVFGCTNSRGNTNKEDLLISIQSGIIICANYHSVKTIHSKSKSGQWSTTMPEDELQRVYCGARYPLSSQFSIFYDLRPISGDESMYEFVLVGPPIYAIRSISWDYSNYYCSAISRDTINIFKFIPTEINNGNNCRFITIDCVSGLFNGFGNSHNCSNSSGCVELPDMYWQDSVLFVNGSIDTAMIFTGFKLTKENSIFTTTSASTNSSTDSESGQKGRQDSERVELVRLSSAVRSAEDLLGSSSSAPAIARPLGVSLQYSIGILNSCLVLTNSDLSAAFSIPLSAFPTALLIYLLSITSPKLNLNSVRPHIMTLVGSHPHMKDYIESILKQKGFDEIKLS